MMLLLLLLLVEMLSIGVLWFDTNSSLHDLETSTNIEQVEVNEAPKPQVAMTARSLSDSAQGATPRLSGETA